MAIFMAVGFYGDTAGTDVISVVKPNGTEADFAQTITRGNKTYELRSLQLEIAPQDLGEVITKGEPICTGTVIESLSSM